METEKLIMLVRERRFLYDATDNDYKSRGKVVEAWLEIAREMGNENGKQWATKWKSLRDNYKKFKKSTETASGSSLYKKYKNWPWADHLCFIDHTNVRNETERNINSENRNSTSQASDSTDRPSSSNGVDLRDSASDSENSTKNKTITQRGDSDTRQQLLKYLHENNPNKRKLDDIDYLFQSYATSMKKMPARMRSMLKLDIAILFAKYEMQIENNITIPPVDSPSTNLPTADSILNKYLSEDSLLQDVKYLEGLSSSREMGEYDTVK